jgi:hypothetical protein
VPQAASIGWREVAALLVQLGANHLAKDGPLRDGQTPYQIAHDAGWSDVCVALKRVQRRRVKLAGGDTLLFSSLFPTSDPEPFGPKRMSVAAVWGRDSKHGAWGRPPDPTLPFYRERVMSLG